LPASARLHRASPVGSRDAAGAALTACRTRAQFSVIVAAPLSALLYKGMVRACCLPCS